MSNNTISLLRANPALTSNVKIVVDSEYNLYLESYNSNIELSDRKFKKFKISPNSFLSNTISTFYKDLPIDIAFEIKNNIKSDNIQLSYNNQYDDIYYSGPRNIEDTSYTEEFQYNTTLKINAKQLPKYFFIFRTDDTGLINLNKENIKDNFLYNLKCIKTFDLSPKENLGKLWKKNYIDDDILPISSFELNSNKYEFSTWNGYDYKSGGTVSKSFFLDETLQNQMSDFEFESFITDGFKKNEVISSNYSNISFLYDDTVCGIFIKGIEYKEQEYPFIFKMIKDGKISSNDYIKSIIDNNNNNNTIYKFSKNIPYRKKWTINRYTGFYVDELILLDKICSYVNDKIKNDSSILIKDNVFVMVDPDNANEYINVSPLINTYNEKIPIYFKIKNDFYLIEKQNDKYVLISDIIFNGNLSDFISNNSKPIKIEFSDPNNSTDPTKYKNYIKYLDGSYYYNLIFEKYLDGIIVIKLFDQYYTLNIDKNNKRIYLNTDELIFCNTNILTRQLGEDIKYNNLQILSKDNVIDYFEIFVLKYTDIKDFDFKRTNTDHTKIEYDSNNSISYNRPFFYQLDLNDISLPIDVYYEKNYNIYLNDSNTLLYSNQYILPTSSEYASSGDLYVINSSNTLTRIWDINQSVVKFGYSNSIGSNSVPYKLNNSLDVWGQFNMNCNLYNNIISPHDLNLDYFYTFGRPIDYDYNDTDTLLNDFSSYVNENIINRTLNIDTILLDSSSTNNLISEYYSPNFIEYKNKYSNFDYFDYILNTPYRLDFIDNQKNLYKKINRISYLNECDGVNGPSVFFKGFNSYLQYVKLDNPNDIDSFKTISSAKDLENYGFSIIFYSKFTEDINKYGTAGIDITINKIFKNILIHIYLNIPNKSYTSLDYRNRDSVYNDEYVKYIIENPILSNDFSFIDSNLKIQDLTLNKVINIISNCKIEDDSYTDGIHYNIIEIEDEFKIINVVPNGTNQIIVTFDKEPNLKEHDWMKFNFTDITEFELNKQIISKINNISYVFNTDVNSTTIFNNLLLNIDNIFITKEKSVLPFRFKIIEPNEIKINNNVNKLVGDSSCPIKPINNTINTQNLIISSDSLTGLVPNVYNNDYISRNIYINNNNKSFSYNDIKSLPSIFRYNGYYDPILTNIELFNSKKLIYNNANTIDLRYVKFIYDEETYMYNLVIGINYDVIYDLEIDDVIYIKKNTNNNLYTNLTTTIKNIYDSTELLGFTEIITNSLFDNNYINIFLANNPTGKLFNIPPITDHVITYKYIEENTIFDYNFMDFGINKDIIISKVQDSINIMRTNSEIYNQTNKFPMIDEHGVTVIDRNVFKSSWDLDYYYTQINNKYNTI